MNTEQLWLHAAAQEILNPLERWAQQCHAASHKLMTSGRFGDCRVARGSCSGVGGQHSWLVIGHDCYDRNATIIDPTLWSYDKEVNGIWVGQMNERYHPHGSGSIWEWGRPDHAVPGQEMELTPREPWSDEAQLFLEMLGPLDKKGWILLAHAPVEGWPSGEIIDAMCESGLGAYVPIDIVGMVTDRNPSGLYLPEKEPST
jgi:hypothetical protein